MKPWDILIIGAGAAGLMASIAAGREAQACNKQLRIAAMDGARKLGAKILVSGGGRCNVTHDVVNPRDYAGESNNRIKRILQTFTVEQTIAFFEELGITLKREETGKLFPITDCAQTILDALLREAQRVHVHLLADHRVLHIQRHEEAPNGTTRFQVETSQGVYEAKQIILATGGLSLPKTGSDGAGYAFARALGHTVTPTTPALVPLVLPKGHWLTQLSGISLQTSLRLIDGRAKLLHEQAGAMLFTHFGISGPAPMDISRHWLAARRRDPQAQLVADLTAHKYPTVHGKPMPFEKLDAMLVQMQGEKPKQTIMDLLANFDLPRRFIEAFCEHAIGISHGLSLNQLGRDVRRTIAHQLLALPLPVERDRGYLFAEVTAGGVPLAEVDLATMASRVCKSLHLCGEILNVDGRIGGYNFQWAWCTGRLAGMYAVRVMD